MSQPTDKEPCFRLLPVAIFLFLLAAFTADGCRTCVDLCADRGETWHWTHGGGLPPIVDACTCVGADGVLRRVPVSSEPTGDTR